MLEVVRNNIFTKSLLDATIQDGSTRERSDVTLTPNFFWLTIYYVKYKSSL